MSTTAQPTREDRTITVDFQNETTYFQLLGDGKAFLERSSVAERYHSFTRAVSV
jgi:hypothetical protein